MYDFEFVKPSTIADAVKALALLRPWQLQVDSGHRREQVSSAAIDPLRTVAGCASGRSAVKVRGDMSGKVTICT